MSKYNFELDLNNKNVLSVIIKAIQPNSKVLEFGPANGRMTKHLKEVLHCEVDIVEIDSDAGKEAAKFARKALIGSEEGDIEKDIWLRELGKNVYDYIIFADVLEHLYSPVVALNKCKKLIRSNGEILISIPNIAHNAILNNLYFNEFNYTDVGLLDNTHIRFWGLSNFEKICDELDFAIQCIDTIDIDMNSTEQARFFNEENEELITLLKKRPYGNVYQFIINIRKKNKDYVIPYKLLPTTQVPMAMAIYLDIGAGYTEDYAIKDSSVLGEQYSKSFNLTQFEDVKNIRIDPVKRISCNIKNFKIESNLGILDAVPLNSLYQNDVEEWFESKEPMYQIIDLEEKIEWIKVEFIAKHVSNLELLKIRKEMNQKMQNYLEQLEYEVKLAKKQLEQKEICIQNTQEQLEQKEICIQNTQDQLEQKEICIQNTQDQLEQKEICIQNMQDQLNEVWMQLNQTKFQYEVISTSQFWRMTKPLRLIVDQFKKSSIGNILFKVCFSVKQEGMRATIDKILYKLELRFPKFTRYNGFRRMNKQNKRVETMTEKQFVTLVDLCKGSGRKIYLQDRLTELDNKESDKVLLISHELSMTGAPIALHYMAKVLKNLNFSPVIVSPFDGKMATEIVEDDIPIIIIPDLVYSNWISSVSHMFSFAVANTAVTFYAIKELLDLSLETLWWIHESEVSYTTGGLEPVIPREVSNNIHIFCGGEYAQSVLKKYRPNLASQILLYCVPDTFDKEKKLGSFVSVGKSKGKFVFAVIGTFEERKAQDKLVQAIRVLPENILKKCMFMFVGKHCYEQVDRAVDNILLQYPDNITYIEEVSRNDLFKLYNSVDCVVCTSKDDPMPVFITEALMLSKLVICSEFTGSAPLIERNKAGFIYYNNSVEDLKNKLIYVIENHKNLDDIRNNARKLYEEQFAVDVFENSVKKVVEELSLNHNGKEFYNQKVSIVIPTYNPGSELKKTLSILRTQKNVKEIEIVLIDSGSQNIQDDIFKKADILIQITQSEFSHSYARNTGAQNSTGEIIIFMTQDAIPSSNYWVSNIIYSIWHEDNVAAVSCLEECPVETELYYKCAARMHASYLGAINCDVYGEYSDGMGCMELRKNASLNDVACAINREIFESFLYRFNYAEDLDLGIRLIKSGHKIKVLESERVIHGHNRNAGYYLRRSCIEGTTLEQIFGSKYIEKISAKTAYNKIISAFMVLSKVTAKIEKQEYKRYNVSSYLELVSTYFNGCMKKENNKRLNIEVNRFKDQIITEFLNNIIEWTETFEYDAELIAHINYYFNQNLKIYIRKEFTELNLNLINEIIDALIKQLCVNCGVLIAKISDDSKMREYVEVLGKGV